MRLRDQRRVCLKRCANPYSLGIRREVSLQAARIIQGLDPFPKPEVPFKVTTLRRGSLKAKTLSFRISVDQFKPKAAQITKWSVLVQRPDYFVPEAAQMAHMVPSHPDVSKQFWWHFELSPVGRLSLATAFSSEWFRNSPSIRNGFSFGMAPE